MKIKIEKGENEEFYPAEVKIISDDEALIRQFSPIGGPSMTKEAILARHQPLGGPILTWEGLKALHTPLD